MKKKLLLVLLAVVMLSNSFMISNTFVFAATDTANTKNIMNALKIMEIDKGNLSDSSKVTRAQFAQMLINMSSLKGKVSSKSNVSPYKDIKSTFWAAGYIKTAIEQGWMTGYLDGNFKPNQNITLQEAVGAIAKLLGYTNSDFTGNIITGQMALYKKKELDTNITKTRKEELTSNDCMNLFYNTLVTTAKDGKVYADTIGIALDEEGEIDYLAMVNSNIKGPIIADGKWQSKLPFTVSEATIYRDDVISSFVRIEEYDVIYYSNELKSIWVYDNKVTGTIQNIASGQLIPDSVTVSGKTYSFINKTIARDFSTVGSYSKGDVITLLLDNDDIVVGATNVDEMDVTITGVILDVDEHLVEDADGIFTYSNYITFVDAKGNEYEQDYDKAKQAFTEGELVRVYYEDGKVSLGNYTVGSISFNGDALSSVTYSIGEYKLASNVKILDLNNDRYASVYPSRLDGVNLSSDTVLYYDTNGGGEITELILNNLTYDLYDYGILTDISYGVNGSMNFDYLINGIAGIATESSSSIYTNNGPKGFLLNKNELVSTINLEEVSVTSIGKTTVQNSTTRYKLAEDVQVYYLINNVYSATTIGNISNLSKYKVTGYYDRTMSTGGLIRVLVAESKQ